MRFNLLARRMAAPALGLALAATVAACSSSSTSSAAAVAVESSAASARQFRRAEQPRYRVDGRRGGADHRELGEVLRRQHSRHGKGQTAAEREPRSSPPSRPSPAFPLASGIGAKVTNVTVNSATKAAVTYNLTSSGGSALLSNQKGVAVYQDGTWKVGDESLCGLFRLIPGGTVPAACNSAG